MTIGSVGGRGGDAHVDGENSSAEGGKGGDAAEENGGRGGDACVEGDNIRAIGGLGGRGGITPGAPGGDAYAARNATEFECLLTIRGQEDTKEGGGGGSGYVAADSVLEALIVGGQGGEAGQRDGRGGRGGRVFISPELREFLGLPDRGNKKWPYFEPVTEPGRGGDGEDTPQYKARRIIVEQLKRRYFRNKNLDLAEAWWDRTVVPMGWLNEQLCHEGHRWQASIVDDEYEFVDHPNGASAAL
ncbi:hypothetical protein LGR54_18025 [Ancylobacter sp. Lp-2]|uniref:hypothetical protein n=1 Tax=Ancylobacter sp. Lp-2 TaxID=2881339 RepID=UPI001E61D78B|nr:hypothetical protein [Ancylobacter sp. Lp-2]MCB4770509.1 hypothetical protein [Ancylobacter sp. Lp-2]